MRTVSRVLSCRLCLRLLCGLHGKTGTCWRGKSRGPAMKNEPESSTRRINIFMTIWVRIPPFLFYRTRCPVAPTPLHSFPLSSLLSLSSYLTPFLSFQSPPFPSLSSSLLSFHISPLSSLLSQDNTRVIRNESTTGLHSRN